MSRARTLAGAIGSDGALNVADVAGLAAVASSGSASDLSTGTLPIARVADGAVTAAKLASTAVTDKLGFTPVNKAGDTMTGALGVGSFTHGGNSGEARFGRGDDRSVGVATVQLGGTSGNKFEIVDRAWSKVLLTVNDDGSSTLNGNSTVTGSLTVNGGTSFSGNMSSTSGSTYVPAGGTLAFNIESIFGVIAAGLLIVTGNENGVNSTVRTYSWNHSFYGYASNTRYVRLKAIDTNQLSNGYGDVYAYLSNNAASYTSLDQNASGTASSTSNIYFRNAVGQGCNVGWTIWKT